jgi:hypothetical protein
MAFYLCSWRQMRLNHYIFLAHAFCLRQATHAVTLRVMSGGFRSPKCSLNASTDALAEADGDMVDNSASGFGDNDSVKVGSLIDQ